MATSDSKYFWRDGDPLWYKDAIIYEVHVRTFFDSNGDGIGDLPGLIEKLDYLRDLGVTAIWLLPFYPSPFKDDGYDVADYTSIHPNYGTIRDFRVLLREANYRGLRVITELILNHTSDQHPWFQRARHAEAGSPGRDFYVWSNTWDRYNDVRIIFKDFESSNWTWDPVARAYYWHRFYSHQPDLNYDNPLVKQAIFRAINFWLDMGVSGLRLDAVPYLYEREGTNCENLPETHQFLKELRRHVEKNYANRMLLGEANQWAEDAIAYFGQGDECHMAYNFPLMPRMFMAIRMEDRFPIVDILEHTPQIPDPSQWALFLRNHDELTLEMVTDEERDYMYRVYAYDTQARLNLGIRRRLAPLLNNDRKKIELMNGLLFSLPGTPVIYYGDEIGMGDNFYLGDRNGVRTPMQWSADRNAGFSNANPQRLYLPIIIDPEYHYEAINVDTQQNNPDSLLWWTKRLIALRKRFKAFGQGSIKFLTPENRKVLAFTRRYRDETVLVVANLSRTVQHTSLDLADFSGQVPVEAFGQTEFPRIEETPYFLTLSPFAFYWFALQPYQPAQIDLSTAPAVVSVPTLTLTGEWKNLYNRRNKPALASAMLSYIKQRRWYGGKARNSRAVDIQDIIPLEYDTATAHLVLVRIDYSEGEPETYFLPVTFALAEPASQVSEQSPGAVIAHLRVRDKNGEKAGIIYDAMIEPAFHGILLKAMARRRHFRGEKGEMTAAYTRGMSRKLLEPARESQASYLLPGEQSNTSAIYGDRFKLKLFRKLDEGISPELEIGRFLTEKDPFPNSPAIAGYLEYNSRRLREPITLGILHGFVRNEGDGWNHALDALGRFFETVLANPELEPPLPQGGSFVEMSGETPPPIVSSTIGPYLVSADLLGQRTAELHIKLASAMEDPGFVPEPFSASYQRSLYHGMRGFASQVLQLLRRRLNRLPDEARADARKVLSLENTIIEHLRDMTVRRITGMRIRCHGDYHLGQVLYTGNDFVIIDFEGEPARRLGERRIKRSPLRDVAGMIRSFNYAAYSALRGQASTLLRPEDLPVLERWAHFWYHWVSATFLKSYLELMADTPILPQSREGIRVVLDTYLLDKVIYEVNYELNNRPDWVGLPLRGILEILGDEAEPDETAKESGKAAGEKSAR